MSDPAQRTPAEKMIGEFAPKLVSLTDDVLFADVSDRAGLEAAEDRLQTAVAANDAAALATVLHDMLVATAPGGAPD